jgi:hypothetical protein
LRHFCAEIWDCWLFNNWFLGCVLNALFCDGVFIGLKNCASYCNFIMINDRAWVLHLITVTVIRWLLDWAFFIWFVLIILVFWLLWHHDTLFDINRAVSLHPAFSNFRQWAATSHSSLIIILNILVVNWWKVSSTRKACGRPHITIRVIIHIISSNKTLNMSHSSLWPTLINSHIIRVFEKLLGTFSP